MDDDAPDSGVDLAREREWDDAPTAAETAAEREREERRDEERELLSRYARERRSARSPQLDMDFNPRGTDP